MLPVSRVAASHRRPSHLLPRPRRSAFAATRPLSAAPRLVALAFVSLLSSGCGGFVVDGGIFPLPTIHLVYPYPIQVGLPFESVTLTSTNGQPLYGWWIPSEDARATVLVHHGAVVNRSSHLAHYQLLHELGYHVFIYDYQGFGESIVLASLDTILDDADAALAYVQSRQEPGTERIILFGLSMGTMPALAQAARSPDRVTGVVLEGSFIQTELPPFAYLLLGIQPSPLAFERIPAPLDPVTNAPRVTLPKCFLHSVHDFTTPISSSRRLYELAPAPKEFIELIGAHIDSINVDLAYRDHLERVLAEMAGR